MYILLGLMFVCECGCSISFQVGFWEGRGFESVSWILGDLGLSLYLDFGGTWV